MLRLAVFSSAGGQGKTTSAVCLAHAAARSGLRTVLIDADSRATATRWLQAEPVQAGLHLGAILAAVDPRGWGEELATQTTWDPLLRCIPGSKRLAHREADATVTPERLAVSIASMSAEVAIIDCGPRHGGTVTANVLRAASHVLVAAQPTDDGIDGVTDALEMLGEQPAATRPTLAGIIATSVPTRRSATVRAALETYAESGHLLMPPIPERQAVREARNALGPLRGYWGMSVMDAYTNILETIRSNQ